MLKEQITQGNTIDEAIEDGCLKLGISRDDAGIEILEYPKSKTFGLFGGTPAKVRVYFDDGKEEPKPVKDFIEKKPEEKKSVMEKPASPAEVKKQSDTPDRKRPQEKSFTPAENYNNEPSRAEDSGKAVGTVIEDESKLDPNVPPLSSAIYLRSILAGMDMDATVTIRVEDERTANLDVSGSQMGAIIGRRGEVSAALQYLVSLAANSRKDDSYYRISVNIGKYRQRRDGMIEELASKTAARSLRIGKNIAFEPMNPYERRVVHTTIQNIEGAASWSLGEGRDRHVVVGPAGLHEGEEGLPPRREYEDRGRYNNRDNRGRGGYNRNGFRRDDRGGYGSRRDDRGYGRDSRSSGYDRHSDIKTMPNDYNQPVRSEPKKDVQAPLYGRIQVPKKDEE